MHRGQLAQICPLRVYLHASVLLNIYVTLNVFGQCLLRRPFPTAFPGAAWSQVAVSRRPLLSIDFNFDMAFKPCLRILSFSIFFFQDSKRLNQHGSFLCCAPEASKVLWTTFPQSLLSLHSLPTLHNHPVNSLCAENQSFSLFEGVGRG